MRKLVCMMFVLLLCSMHLFAQDKTVTGKVTDQKDGTPLAGVSITVKGTTIGTTTGTDGLFRLNIPVNAKTLVFSFVNYQNIEMAIGSRSSFNVSLATIEKSLQEVVVVGYTRTTKEAFTGSAKSVSGEQLNNKSVSNISQALAGEVAGVRVINPSGQPGTSAVVRIRGFGSVNGNRSPLYVVDGVPFTGNLSSINPNDILSTTVLKDAAATSIYGSRGANGVIVITTRSGRSKKSFIEADGRFGINQSILPRYDVLTSPEEFIVLGWEALYNEGVKIGNSDPTNYANTRLFSTNGISTNNNIWNAATGAALIDPATKTIRPGVTRKYDPERWQDYAFQPSNRLEANLRFGGGDSRTNYYTSFGYLNDIGYSINTDYRRIGGRINFNHEVKKWFSTNFNVNYSNSRSNNNGQGSSSNSVFWFVDNMPSIYPLFMRDASGQKIADPIFGGFRYDYGETGRKFGSLTNAIADATFNTNRTTTNELTGNTSATIKFTDYLSLENRLGVQYYGSTGNILTNKFYGSAASQNGSIFHQRDLLMNLNMLSMLRFAKRFGEHNVEAIAAHEATKYTFTRATASGYNLVSNYNLELSNAIVINPTANTYANTNNLESYFAQVNYDYDATYYLSGTVRRDGSSRFVKGNAWGTFGSVGAGWVVSKMKFMDKANLVKYLKLKASYGILGDQSGLGFYPGYTNISIGNLNNLPSFGVPIPGNPDLTWETSRMFQAGVEFRLRSFLEGTIDYYVKNTENLIFERRVGPSNGYALITVNDGQLSNSGIEFELTGHILKGANYFLDLGINGEHFKNKITAMPIDPSTEKQKIIDPQGSFGWAKGHSIFDFYIRNFAGVDPADGTSTWTVYYDDLNSNSTFDAGEQVLNLEQFLADNPNKKGTLKTGSTKNYTQATQYYIGKSSIPKIRGAVNLSGGGKGFELSVQLLYSFGGYSYDGAYSGLMGNGLIGGNNWSTDIRRRWQKSGDITDVPRISNNADVNVTSLSSRFLTKANYLSLNNIRLGYSFPANLTKRLGIIDAASLFVSGDNLWLHTARRGFNPSTSESGNSDTYRYSPLSTITFGFKLKF